MATRQQSPENNSGSQKKYDPHATRMPPGATVGKDVPDESKEHRTEIAVEKGEKIGTEHQRHD